MTFDIHFRREQTWLLWLPLIVVVCFLPGLISASDILLNHVLAIARGIVLVIALLLCHGIGFRLFGNLGVRYAKEFRSQSRGVILAIFIPSLLGSFPDPNLGALVLPVGAFYVIGCATLGATAFGIEYEHRTLGVLLAQPVSRWLLLAEKLVPLAVLLALSYVQLILATLIHTLPDSSWTELRLPAEFGEFLLLAMIPPVFAFCTGPALALLTRRTLAAGVFTVAIPPILFLGVWISCSTLYKFIYAVEHNQSYFDPTPLDHPGVFPMAVMSLAVLFVLYLVAGLAGTVVLFQRLGWKESAAQASSSGVHPLAVPLDRFLGAALGRSKIPALIRKELRLHPAPFLVAMLGTGCWLLWLWANHLNSTEFPLDSDIALAAVMILGGLVSVVAGASCVAEERQLGTLDWQLTQPSSVRQQWSIKLAVAFGIATLLGGALPIILARYGLPQAAFSKSTDDMLRLFSFMPFLFAAAVYASSVCRNSINATVMSLPVAATLIALGLIPGAIIFETSIPTHTAFSPTLLILLLTCSVLAPMIFLTLWMAWRNFRYSVVGIAQMIRQILLLSLGAIVLSAITSVGLIAFFMLPNLVKDESPVEEASEASNFVPPAKSSQTNGERSLVQMDPALMKRYGLVASSNPTVTNVVPGTTNTNAIFKMDPALMRRYGLLPKPAPAQK